MNFPDSWGRRSGWWSCSSWAPLLAAASGPGKICTKPFCTFAKTWPTAFASKEERLTFLHHTFGLVPHFLHPPPRFHLRPKQTRCQNYGFGHTKNSLQHLTVRLSSHYWSPGVWHSNCSGERQKVCLMDWLHQAQTARQNHAKRSEMKKLLVLSCFLD